MIADPLGEAVRRVRDGGLLAYPTETVWGLGADARSPEALARLGAWKRAEHPLSVLVADAGDLEPAGLRPGPAARRLVERFWPGPLTLVLPCEGGFAAGVAREDGAVGVRCSPHPVAAALARRLRDAGVGPVTSTSLNRSGEPPARTRPEARALCGEAPGEPTLLSVPGADAGGGPASSVVDCTGEKPQVLRAGALAEEEIAAALRGLAP